MKPTLEYRAPRGSHMAKVLKEKSYPPSAGSAATPARAKSATPARKVPSSTPAARATASPTAASSAKATTSATAGPGADLPALKARFTAGTMSKADRQAIIVIIDAAQARRIKNKQKQANWRDRQKK